LNTQNIRNDNGQRWACGVYLICLLFLGCAAQGPPSGGPPDEEGPRLLYTVPEDGATQVGDIDRVEFFFSEPIDSRSIVNALEITPPLNDEPLLRVQKKKLIVSWQDTLGSDRSYIFSFGRNIKDYRGNPSLQEVRLAFATGDSLDEGRIAGRVYSIPENRHTAVWCYRSKAGFPDTLYSGQPDYRAVVNADGGFQLQNLARGHYRLLAVCSSNPRPRALMPQDLLGIPSADSLWIRNRRDRIDTISLKLQSFPMEPFELRSVAVQGGRLVCTFSQAPHDSSLHAAGWYLGSDSQLQDGPRWIAPDQPQQIVLIPEGLSADQETSIGWSGLSSVHGDSLRDQALSFRWRSDPDTLPPYLVTADPSNGSRNVPLDSPVELIFSEAIRGPALAESLSLWKQDSVRIAVEIRQPWDNRIRLRPIEPLESNMDYQLKMDLFDWTDAYGNSFADSTLVQHFHSVDVQQFGSIAGRLLFSGPASRMNWIAEAVALGQDRVAGAAAIDSSGHFRIDRLLPDTYRIQIFQDRDADQSYDSGSLIPFRPSERLYQFGGEFEVRSRWVQEIPDLELR